MVFVWLWGFRVYTALGLWGFRASGVLGFRVKGGFGDVGLHSAGSVETRRLAADVCRWDGVALPFCWLSALFVAE